MLKITILCDFEEEGWHSMDLVSAMLFEELAKITERFTGADLERFITALQKNSLFNKISTLAQKPGFLDKVAKLIDHPMNKYLLSAEAVLLLLFFIFQESQNH